MKTEALRLLVLLPAIAGGLSACREKAPPAPGAPAAQTAPAAGPALETADIPVLRIEPGDEWRYRVTIRNPQEERSAKAPAVGSYERVRRFIGKVDPGEDRPPADCYEVFSPGAAKIREFVEIQPEQVALRGQSIVGADGAQHSLIWYEPPIPFFSAGLTGGETLPPVRGGEGAQNRWTTQVIGREVIEVPAGRFETVRLQMTGVEGELGIRRSYWFAPGIGVVREETVQESPEKVPLLSESQELLEIRHPQK